MDIGLPFIRWIDALPYCAKAIRDKAVPSEQHLAGILEVKSLLTKQELPNALLKARELIKKHPDQGYFYYVVTLSENHEDGLRFAKKGLKCRLVAPFVRFQLLQRAVEHAGGMGIIALHQSGHGESQKWEEGMAFLTSALEDATTYIEEAPPDIRAMKNVLYWYILLTLAMHGADIKEDLSGLQVWPDVYQLCFIAHLFITLGCAREAQNL